MSRVTNRQMRPIAVRTRFRCWVFTYDANINEQAIYVDGGGASNTLLRTSTGDFIGSGTNNFWVGRRRDGQNFDGQIDDVQMYAGILTGADVATLFATPGSTIAAVQRKASKSRKSATTAA